MLMPFAIPHNIIRPPRDNTGEATATVTGTATWNNVLTCTFNNNDPDGAAIAGPTYQWIRDANTTIVGATSSTYTSVVADVGHTVKCRVGYTDGLGFAESIDSNSTATIAAGADTGDATASVAFINGVAQQGQLCTCTFNNNDPDGAAVPGSVFYQWYVAAVTQIPGATSSTFVPTASQVGFTIKCRVSYQDAHGNQEVIFSPNTATVAGVTTGVFFLQDAAGLGGFSMPNYNTAVLEVWGGGCGGSAAFLTGAPVQAVAGGNSSCTSPGIGLVAAGGSPPTGGSATTVETQAAAATASGGNSTNANGGVGGVGQIVSGGVGVSAASGDGGTSPAGGTGGASVSHVANNGNTNGLQGSAPGSGGSGNASGSASVARAKGTAGGNAGAYSRSNYVLGGGSSPNVGASFTATVGAGSTGATVGGTSGGPGVNGRVRLIVTS